MKVIQLRGTNATGKTTAIRQFIQRGNFRVTSIRVRGKDIEFHYDDGRRIAILGRYDLNVSGGIDGRITDRNVLLDSIIKIIKTIQPEILLFEGIVYGVTFKFAHELYHVLRSLNYDYIGICLLPPLEIAFKRLEVRNGGKPVDLLKVQDKWFETARAAEKLQKHGVPIKVIDSSKIPFEHMYRIVEDAL